MLYRQKKAKWTCFSHIFPKRRKRRKLFFATNFRFEHVETGPVVSGCKLPCFHRENLGKEKSKQKICWDSLKTG